MNNKFSTVALKWQEQLACGGYDKRLKSWLDFYFFSKLSRTWRIIIGFIKLKPGSSVFEFGCGGGNQLVPLALNGYECYGIDCSKDVLDRCRILIGDVEKFIKNPLKIKLYEGEFLNFISDNIYDLVFNFGVIEHFINDKERNKAIQKMFNLCRPGGYVVSVVPNGTHPMRNKMREEGLGGYSVPEIDYDPKMMKDEMINAGAKEVLVIPHNLCGYLLMDTNISTLKRIIYYSIYYMVQFLPFLPWFQSDMSFKHATSLICIAKKYKQSFDSLSLSIINP